MAQSSFLTVGSSTPVAVTADNQGDAIITIREDPSVSGWPTTDFLVSIPTSGQQQIRFRAGQSKSFGGLGTRYNAGQTVAYVQTVTGTTTFQKESAP